jgi:hypothetical protein
LNGLHTERRDLVAAITRRLESDQAVDAPRLPSWLWADVGEPAMWRKKNPEGLRGPELTAWAKATFERRLEERLDEIDPRLVPGAVLSATENGGELSFAIDGVVVVDGIYLDGREAPFIAAQWRQKARTTNVTETFDARKLVKLLLDLRGTENAALKDQVIQLDARVVDLDRRIEAAEGEMNAVLYKLYKLTESERRLVADDRRRRRR